MQGNVFGQSGGSAKINGIIEEYKVANGGNVNAGDFVKFVNDYSNLDEIEETELSSIDFSGSIISATVLSDNRVFIAHGNPRNYLYGMICTIVEGKIVVGSDTQIAPVNNAGYIVVTALSEDKVFIAHSRSVSSSSTVSALYGIVCTIDGTTITAGVDTEMRLSNNDYECEVTRLSNDKVFIVCYCYETSYFLYGIVCTVDGTTITIGTKTILNNGSIAKANSILTLSSDKVFITYGNTTYYRTYGMICTVLETTITKDSDTFLTQETKSTIGKAVLLDENKIFLLYIGEVNGESYFYGKVCMINEGEINKGIGIQLSTQSKISANFSVEKIENNEIFVAYTVTSDDSRPLYGMTCKIEEEDIIPNSDICISRAKYAGSSPCVVTNNNSNVLITYCINDKEATGHNYQLYGITLNYFSSFVKAILEKTELINGIAKTSGRTGEIIKAYKPNI